MSAKKLNEQDRPLYPLLRVITFGEFKIERLAATSLDSVGAPSYARVLPEEWENRSSVLLLLKFLLCREERRASKEDLITALWPDKTVLNTEHTFDAVASLLRRRMLRTSTGESLLLTLHTSRGSSLKLATQHFLWVDADALLALSSQSLRVISRGQNPLVLLEKAYTLARGEFLEDDLAYPWTHRRRHTLNGARRRIFYKLVELYLKEKLIWRAEELLYTFLEEHPTDEDALCHLMVLLTEQGRRQEALQLYHYTVDLLHEEKRGPAPYTKELAARVRNGAAIKEQATNYLAAAIVTMPQIGQPPEAKPLRIFRMFLLQIHMLLIIFLHYIAERWSTMRMEVDKIYYGNYLFRVELDTGAETGENQLTVWFAEKINTASFPLTRFKPEQLFKALLEPYKSSLHAQLEQEKSQRRKPFQEEIDGLRNSFAASEKRKVPAKVKRQINDLRRQMNIALKRQEADFTHRAVLPLDRSCFDMEILQSSSNYFEHERFLRDFYFEEASKQYIRNFCRKFANDEIYRQRVLAQEISWSKRNALFLRNLFTLFGEHFHPTDAHEYEKKAHDFFHWINQHYKEILALPEYQKLQQLDNAFMPNANELDPFIRPAVELLNRIPGITTRYSCQGVSGKVQFQGYSLLVVSEHEEYAYVSFAQMEQPAKNIIEGLLSQFPSITNAQLPGTFALWSVLRSTGDNLRFRTELRELAQRALAEADKMTVRTEQG